MFASLLWTFRFYVEMFYQRMLMEYISPSEYDIPYLHTKITYYECWKGSSRKVDIRWIWIYNI